MRVRLLLVPAIVVAIVYSCAGSDHFTATGTGTGIGGQPGPRTLPDGGPIPDAGPPPDAGPVPDAGCNTQLLPFGTVFVNDTCFVPGTTTQTNATIIPNGCADVKIFLGDGFNCAGSIAGAANAFTGTCSSDPCSSTRLPGTLTCTLLNSTTCNIQGCADASWADCPV